MRKTLIVGILAFAMVASAGLVSATVDVDMDVNDGSVDITTNGIDHSTWHPGTIGETNAFSGLGSFSGNYHANEGTYGILHSYINVNSKSGGADFEMTDHQDFNVMSANHIYNVDGYFYAHASGNDDQVAMNLKSVGSMYVWSEATNPWSAPCLRGSVIEKEVWTNQNGVSKTDLYLGVSTNGIATMHNSNIWGWYNGEHGSSSTNYGRGTRDVSATGSGTYTQSVFGANSFNFNGFNSPHGGSMIMTGTFTDGFNFNGYSMSAN
ncbi:MAG: hypothetical protein GWP09_03100 [Nitrospiraceae bacterium]|nr:hypothetical protein [Nitrospiraceae bacterium]